MRISRGCGVDALAGIRSHRDDAVVRPLLTIERADLLACARALDIQWREDPSNQTGPYARNRIRHKVLPALDEVQPGAAAAIARTAQNMALYSDSLGHWIRRALADQIVDEHLAGGAVEGSHAAESERERIDLPQRHHAGHRDQAEPQRQQAQQRLGQHDQPAAVEAIRRVAGERQQHQLRAELQRHGDAHGAGIVVGAGVYRAGITVPVTATRNPGFRFDNWSGDCVGTGRCNVFMDADKAVTANFSRSEFTLITNALPAVGGAVAGSGTYQIGRVVPVTQVANAGFTFDNWSGDCSGTGSCTVTMDQDKDVEANYSAAVPPPQPPAGCNPTPAGAAPVLNSIDMSSGYPRQMLAVNGDTTGASVIWGAGSGTETTITTGVGGTRYFQIPENATPGSYPVAIRVGADTSNIVCVTVLAVSGAFPAPRIEDIGLNGRTGSDIALTVSAANMDADATLTVNGVPIPNAALWSALPIPYLNSHVPASYGYPIYHYSQLKGIVSNATPGSVLNVTVTNTDGQASSKSYNLPPSWAALDSDGDGLLDTWEDSGYTRPGGGTVNLPAMGASKYRKDILIESDWVAVAAPSVNVFTTSINTFAQAPVLNPDGSKGIDLIIDRGQGGPFTEGGEILAPHNTIWFGGISNGSYKNFYDYKPTNFNSDRLGLFHYNVFGRRSPTGSSGVAEGPGGGPDRGDDFLVSCDWCNEGGLIGTFLHELGHNLNLHHGGLVWPPESQNWHENAFRPNNPSIMSYRYQIFGTNTSCTKSNDGLYTYSQGQMRTINELNTDERIGICDNIALDLSEPFPDGIISTGRINSDDPQNRNSNFRTADDTHVDQDQWGQIILDFQNN